MTKEKAIELMRKLKAQAESEAGMGNMAAAETYGIKLKNLMTRYCVELSDLEWEEEKKEIRQEVWMCRHTADWVTTLVSIVADSNSCRGCSTGHPHIYFFIGHPVATEACVQSVSYLLTFILNAAGEAYIKGGSQFRQLIVSLEEFPQEEFSKNFAYGFLNRYKTRLEEDKNEVLIQQCALVRKSESLTVADEFLKKVGAIYVKESAQVSDIFAYFSGVSEAEKVVMPSNKKRMLGEEE